MRQKILLFASLGLVAILCLIVWAAAPVLFSINENRLNAIEAISKILAFTAVAAYAIYKFLSGFHLTNMTLDLEIDRKPKSGGMDYLAVSVKLIKGDRGTVVLKDVHGCIVPAPGDRQPLILTGFDRMDTGELRKSMWDTSDHRPYLYLTPGETLTVAGLAVIPSDMPCTIEVAVAGKTPTYWRSGQWRISRVSLPAT